MVVESRVHLVVAALQAALVAWALLAKGMLVLLDVKEVLSRSTVVAVVAVLGALGPQEFAHPRPAAAMVAAA